MGMILTVRQVGRNTSGSYTFLSL